MNQEEKYIGYLKYSGKSIEDGLLLQENLQKLF